MSFFVLIHGKKPMFLSDSAESGDEPIEYGSRIAASADTERNLACRRLGYTIIEWDELEGLIPNG